MHDTVVIGSGVGGMTAAVILAKHGRRVVVLEQSHTPGGLMATYSRGGLVFPTGVHSLGGLAPGQVLWRYFKYLGVLDRLRLAPLDPDGIQQLYFPGMTFRVPVGHDAFRQRLHRAFPAEASAIDRFFTKMADLVRQFPLYTLTDDPDLCAEEIPEVSLHEYLASLTTNHRLAAILSALNVLVGLEPRECPLHVYCLLLDSVLNGTCRIDEGRTPLAAAFVDELESQGGRVETGARVARILHDNNGVQGVRLVDGEELRARNVVFTGHPRQLIDLCAGVGLRPAFKRRLRDTADTPGAFGLCLSWEGGASPVANSDALLYEGWDTADHYRQCLVSRNETPRAIFCAGAAEGDAATVAMCLCQAQEWAPWAASRPGERLPSYRLAKEAVADRVLSALEGHWPGTRDRVKIVDTFTPLTLRDYTLAPGGTAYGIKRTGTTPLPTRTRIPGLYLAGHSVILSGVLGAVISSVSACNDILSDVSLLPSIRSHS